MAKVAPFVPATPLPGLAPSPKSSAYEMVVALPLGSIVFTTLPASSYWEKLVAKVPVPGGGLPLIRCVTWVTFPRGWLSAVTG
jgi:hypothetical protein